MPERDEERWIIPDHDYWERVRDSARGNGEMPLPQSRQTSANKRPSPPVDETDPLALIVAALRENTEAANRAADNALSVRQGVESLGTAFLQKNKQFSKELGSLIVAVDSQTASAEMIGQANDTKYFWGAMGIALGVLLGLLIGIYVIPSLQQLI